MGGNIREKRDQITFPRNWYSSSFSRVKMFVRKAIWPGFSGIRLESNDWFPFHLLFKQHDLVISMLSLSLFASSFFTFFFPLHSARGDCGLLLLGIGQLEKLFPFVHEKHDLVVLFIYFYLFFFIEVSVSYVHLYGIFKYTNEICEI